MTAGFHFDEVVGFEPGRAEEILRAVPAGPGVFALCGAKDGDEPYLTRTADCGGGCGGCWILRRRSRSG